MNGQGHDFNTWSQFSVNIGSHWLGTMADLGVAYISEPSVQFSSVTQSCPALCNPMNRSTPGFPVHHQLPEFTQTHVHRVGDAIQPSCPLLSPSFLPSIFLSIRVFSNKSALCIRWPKYWSFSFSISPSNECSGLISFRIDSFASIYTCYCRKENS